MKTKIGTAIIALLFLTACGPTENKDQKDLAAAEVEKGSEKFILKASNSEFIMLTPQNTLVPSQVDPTKATVFEKIDMGNGKCALKASNGKFVSDDRSKKSILVADRDTNGDWETFEIIALDQSRVQIKSSDGMFVCSDQSKGDTLISDRANAGNWETFDLQKRN